MSWYQSWDQENLRENSNILLPLILVMVAITKALQSFVMVRGIDVEVNMIFKIRRGDNLKFDFIMRRGIINNKNPCDVLLCSYMIKRRILLLTRTMRWWLWRSQWSILFCRSLIKVKFSTDQFRPALGSGCWLIDWSIVTMLKKPQNCPISDFFDLTPKYFLPLLPYTDLLPSSTDPVPPSTNQYRPILTQYHHGSTITAL